LKPLETKAFALTSSPGTCLEATLNFNISCLLRRLSSLFHKNECQVIGMTYLRIYNQLTMHHTGVCRTSVSHVQWRTPRC